MKFSDSPRSAAVVESTQNPTKSIFEAYFSKRREFEGDFMRVSGGNVLEDSEIGCRQPTARELVDQMF